MRSPTQGVRRGFVPGDRPLPTVIVEFCGLPGAGKTRLADGVLRELREQGIPARAGAASVAPAVSAPRRMGRKLLAAGAQGLAAPRGSLGAAARVTAAERRPTDAATRSLQWLVTQRLLARSRWEGGVHVFDEGVVQALWSIGLRGDPERFLAWLGSRRFRWIAADIVVALDVSAEVALGRLEGRASDHSRTQRLSIADRERELRHGAALLARLLRWCEDTVAPPAQIVRVPNAKEDLTSPGISEVVRAVRAHLEGAT